MNRFCRELLLDLGHPLGAACTGSTDDSDPQGRDAKMLIYSGHDSTLVPLLCALDLYDDTWPPYASFLTLEVAVHKVSGERFVRATYVYQCSIVGILRILQVSCQHA